MVNTSRDSAVESASNSRHQASEALDLMERALNLLDSNNGPLDAAAHLDLAIHRLRQCIEDNRCYISDAAIGTVRK